MDAVQKIRRFNRTVTQHIGLLNNSYLGRGRSLAASRMLFEIGIAGSEIRLLRKRLELDSGYATRLIKSIEAEGLVEISRSIEDSRVRLVSLTEAGKAELELLDRLADRSANELLGHLETKQQEKLLSAMQVVTKLLDAGFVTVDVIDPAEPQAQKCLEKYYQELSERFEEGFNVERGISATPDELTPPRGYFVTATLYDEAVGCGALKSPSALPLGMR